MSLDLPLKKNRSHFFKTWLGQLYMVSIICSPAIDHPKIAAMLFDSFFLKFFFAHVAQYSLLLLPPTVHR